MAGQRKIVALVVATLASVGALAGCGGDDGAEDSGLPLASDPAQTVPAEVVADTPGEGGGGAPDTSSPVSDEQYYESLSNYFAESSLSAMGITDPAVGECIGAGLPAAVDRATLEASGYTQDVLENPAGASGPAVQDPAVGAAVMGLVAGCAGPNQILQAMFAELPPEASECIEASGGAQALLDAMMGAMGSMGAMGGGGLNPTAQQETNDAIAQLNADCLQGAGG